MVDITYRMYDGEDKVRPLLESLDLSLGAPLVSLPKILMLLGVEQKV